MCRLHCRREIVGYGVCYGILFSHPGTDVFLGQTFTSFIFSLSLVLTSITWQRYYSCTYRTNGLGSIMER